MVELLARNWGWVALRGVVAILFGLLVLFRPGIGLGLLVLLFGAYAFVDGLFNSISAIRNRYGREHWVTLFIGGLLGMAIGVITFLWPGVTAFALLYLIAAWAVVVGIAEIIAAIRLRTVITDEWLLGLTGVLSVAFGVLLAVFPGLGALTIAIWIGVFALLIGVLLIALAFRLRRWQKEQPGEETAMRRAA